MRRDFFVEIALPIHALGDGLDHEVALREPTEIAAVIRRLDGRRAVRDPERGGLLLRQCCDRLRHQAIRVAFLCRKVEQHDGNAGIGEVGGDLRAHDPCAEHGGLADEQTGRGHGCDQWKEAAPAFLAP